ncbi:MAG: prephenate dehydratase domain-containing protein [Vicinamibacterales bacterium]
MPVSAAARDAAYQGAPGAYSEVAARDLLGDSASLLPCPTLEDMFDAVRDGQARHAVVPVENCLTGAVPNAYELLFAHELQAIGETQVHIEHVLAAPPGATLEGIRRVLSHPVALAQCRRFFAEHPRIEAVAAFDTAGAVEMVMRVGDRTSAALAARRTAAIYGADVIADTLQDHAENWTRFLLVAPAGRIDDSPGPRKALVTFELPHTPGALHHALEPLAAHGLNLTRIQSQPVHGRPFEYRFLVEMTSEDGMTLEKGLEAMRMVTRGLKTFGNYHVG